MPQVVSVPLSVYTQGVTVFEGRRGVPTMAEPKKRRKPGAGRPKGERPPREMVCSFKGYPEFQEWVRELAAARRLPVSVMIEHALMLYAEHHEFPKKAPER